MKLIAKKKSVYKYFQEQYPLGNIIITPHIGGMSEGARFLAYNKSVDLLESYLMEKSEMHKVLAVILARGGSKAIPKKYTNLNGHPLIAYTICEALRSKYITDIVVSSDDENIKEAAEEYGALAPFTRPIELSGDKAKPV